MTNSYFPLRHLAQDNLLSIISFFCFNSRLSPAHWLFPRFAVAHYAIMVADIRFAVDFRTKLNAKGARTTS